MIDTLNIQKPNRTDKIEEFEFLFFTRYITGKAKNILDYITTTKKTND